MRNISRTVAAASRIGVNIAVTEEEPKVNMVSSGKPRAVSACTTVRAAGSSSSSSAAISAKVVWMPWPMSTLGT